MKTITNLILRSVSFLTIVAQIIFSLGGIAVIFATISMFLISGNDKSDFYKYVLKPENLTKGSLLLGGLNAIIIFSCLIVTMIFLRKVVNNINNNDFFVQANLTNIKIMLIAVSVLILANIVSMFIFANGNGRSISNVFANSWSQVGICVIFMAILYTIYIVFKYGVKLQEDSNTVI